MTLSPEVAPGVTMLLVGAQALLMTVDEAYFHRRRGLTRTEAAGHVVDTSLFLAASLIPALLAPERGAFVAFVVLAIVSTLVVTKDEWIHADACEPAEHWVHAVLFAVHAPILIGLGVTWIAAPDHALLRVLPATVAAWGLFQTLYWTVHHASIRRGARREQRVLRPARRALVP
jgi:hypothetical protein